MKSSELKESQINTNPSVIDVGKNVEKVHQMNPNWTEFDWCKYFDREMRREFKKLGMGEPELRKNCGPGCKCGN
jgi:hypothetical protein